MHPLLVSLCPEQVTNLEYLAFYLLVFIVEDKSWLNGLNLSLEETESIWICDIEAGAHLYRKFFVGLAQLVSSMGIRAIFTKVTLLFLLEVLAHLCFVVVVRYVQHLILHFNWQLLQKGKIVRQKFLSFDRLRI